MQRHESDDSYTPIRSLHASKEKNLLKIFRLAMTPRHGVTFSTRHAMATDGGHSCGVGQQPSGTRADGDVDGKRETEKSLYKGLPQPSKSDPSK